MLYDSSYILYVHAIKLIIDCGQSLPKDRKQRSREKVNETGGSPKTSEAIAVGASGCTHGNVGRISKMVFSLCITV